MALIKCKECGNNISDKADSCPKCGYELRGSNDNKNKKEIKKIDSKYLIIIAIIIVGALFLFNQNKNNNQGGNQNNNQNADQNVDQNNGSNPSNNTGYSVYNDKNLGLTYQIPNSYKVTYSDSFTYVGKNIDSKGALIPYVVIGVYKNYNNCVQFLQDFTTELQKNYDDASITINLLSNYIGKYYVYGIQYTYTSSGHLVVDNRYATLINGVVVTIGTKEENVNSQEINSVVETMFKTLEIGG